MPLQSLLLSKDSDLVQSVSRVLGNLEIAVEHCSEPFAAAKRLMDQHFDAILIDCDDQQGAAWVMQSARMAAVNKNSITVAILGEKSPMRSSKLGENFTLSKPLNAKQAESTLRVAKNLMLKHQSEATGSGTTAKPQSAGVGSAPVLVPPPKPQMGAAAQTQLHGPTADASLDEIDLGAGANNVSEAPPALVHSATSAPNRSTELPSGNELMAKMDEAFPSATSHASSSQGSAAAAAPARELAIRTASPHPQTKTEPVAQTNTKSTAEPPPVTGAGKQQTSAAASAAEAKAGLKSAPGTRHSEGIKAAVTEAASPAVQPIPADVPASGPDVRPILTAAASKADSQSKRLPKPAIAAVAGVLIVVGGFSWWRIHKSSTSVRTTPVAVSQPSAPSGSVSPETSAPPTTPVATAPENQTAKPNSTKPAEKPVEKKQASDQEASAAVQPVVHDDQIAVRMPGKAAKGATQDDEEAVAPPTGVVGPGEAPNLGHVVAAVPAAMPAALPPQRLAVSQGVSQGLLIHQVSPAYPALARESHITGAVQLRALIGKDGSVRTLKLIGGHPLLAKAAMDAVRQWRYKPYLLNGQPVEVDTQITVQFKM